MPGRKTEWGKLTDKDFDLIDVVVNHVTEFGSIPGMEYIANALGISRQAVLLRMKFAHKRGILRERPRYATHWLELTPLGEDLYRKRRSERS